MRSWTVLLVAGLGLASGVAHAQSEEVELAPVELPPVEDDPRALMKTEAERYELTDDIRRKYEDLERMRRPVPRARSKAMEFVPNAPPMTVRGTVRASEDGVLLVGVPVSTKVADRLVKTQRAVRVAYEKDIDANTIYKNELVVLYLTSPQLGWRLERLNALKGKQVKLQLKRIRAGVPVLVHIEVM